MNTADGSRTIFDEADRALLPGFERRSVDSSTGVVRALVGGEGPPVLMLHGDPQTHLCWHRIAPFLAEEFTVVLTDLRGRGESHRPSVENDPGAYTKRAMAREQREVMAALGFERFAVVGHDRGARVARRLGLDAPDVVERLAVMDIVPALDFYAGTTAELAQDYFYFFFLTQPSPVPESLIAGDPQRFVDGILFGLSTGDGPYDEAALAAYRAAATAPEAIRAMCDCFRTGYTTDRDHDRHDRAVGRTIEMPTQVYWGEQGVVGRHFDVRAIWRAWCEDVTFVPMPTGHFVPEEAPERVVKTLLPFLRGEGR
jgi:haloacetate dehalogenase